MVKNYENNTSKSAYFYKHKNVSSSLYLTAFFGRVVLIFIVLFIMAVTFGLAPIGVREVRDSFIALLSKGKTDVPAVVSSSARNYAEPLEIIIERIDVDSKVLNPTSEKISDLDNDLLFGAVKYPGSGDLESNREIFIFGHSSELPVIHNKAFKIFNGLKNLKVGDEIKLRSENKEYLYKVSSVVLTTASQAYVNLSETDKKLILSTCDSFGNKEDRYVVTAEFVRSYSIGN